MGYLPGASGARPARQRTALSSDATADLAHDPTSAKMKNEHIHATVYVAACVAALGGLIFGYVILIF